MKIGFDARALVGKRTGIGNYIWHLLDELGQIMPETEFIAYCPQGFSPSIPERIQHYAIRTNKAYPLMSGYFWLKWRSASLITKDNLDVFWAPRTLYPSQLIGNIPVVTTIHDLNHLICPETMPFINRLAHRLYFEHDIARATKVITNSHGTASRAQSLLNTHVDAVVTPGISKEFFPRDASQILAVRQKYNLSKPYILFIGTLEPRKNLSRLLDAFKLLREQENSELTLALVGKRGWKNRDLEAQLDQGIDGVFELGYVPNEDLAALYSGAEVFALPSLYEGYGMPVAEARACGTRIVASDIPELCEAGGTEGFYINPLSVEDLAQGIARAIVSPKTDAENLVTWRQGAQTMAKIFTELAKSNSTKNR